MSKVYSILTDALADAQRCPERPVSVLVDGTGRTYRVVADSESATMAELLASGYRPVVKITRQELLVYPVRREGRLIWVTIPEE